MTIRIGEASSKEGIEHNRLGITLDQLFAFKAHAKTLRRKASQTFHAFVRIFCYMETGRSKQLLRVFVLSQFTLQLKETYV